VIGVGLGKTAFSSIDINISLTTKASASNLISPVNETDNKVELTSLPDERVKKLEQYLKDKKSPLVDYSEYIVEQADKHDLGYTKIVAISGMESSFCQHVPQNDRYNCWGIKKSIPFKNYKEAIEYTSNLLGNYYKVNEMAGIKAKYCPASDGCNPDWATITTKFRNEILASDIK
jgi:hypothetical protein